MYHFTTHCSSQTEVKSTSVHEVPHHWEATTDNCTVKTCPTIIIHLKHPLSKEGQQVLHTLKGSTIGSPVKGSGWTLCTWLVSWVECCIRLWVHTDECDSLVLCETHLPHVPPTSSVQGGGSSLQHTSLVSQTTGENSQMIFTQWYRNSHAASSSTHSHHSLTLHITSHCSLPHWCVWQGVGWIRGISVPLNKPWVWHCLWPVAEILALSKSNTHPTRHVHYNKRSFRESPVWITQIRGRLWQWQYQLCLK